MVAIEILSAIVEAVLGYVLDQSSLADWARRKLGREPTHLVFRRALGRAAEAFEAQHPDWAPSLLDSGFLHREGKSVLAQFLVRDGRPAPSELAERWADYRHVHDPRGRTVYARVLEPIAADFLESLSHELKAEPELGDLYDSRAFESLALDVAAIRRHLGADQATPGTRRDYLHWLIECNLYLDSRGTFQTQRQVQVRLDEVYISLRAQREETPGAVDRRLMERELAELEARLAEDQPPAEEAEDRREQLLARFGRLGLGTIAGRAGEVIELSAAAKRHDRLIILGDPGSGKTTLLRYLALQHAQALWDGRSQAGPGGELGPARFPILIRIADYAENGTWQRKPFSNFLSEHCAVHECPGDGLADLLARALAAGDSLILLDGLDEIVDADDRRGIVGRIEDFVRRYGNRPNRFVVTSRVAGYRGAPLSAPFAHYTVQEMDEVQIRRFLERWCPAVEAAQTPDLSPEARQATAQREIDGIMRAVEGSAGVRRLAANPLMLRTLALIHRTGAQLPQKRIELYRLAADTLARTWRVAYGVPESALVEEQYLTRLLGRLAYWIHLHKPTGIATEREVYAVLGAEWARIHHLEWDEDDPNPEILAQVDTFLRAVREHTGLFVERAPRRYGFMHLTFEEYYAARHLVARRRNAAQMIRGHLHDPRWDEPILLALGFVGLDYPEEAAELLETAILAQGEEAKELGFRPSPYEEILGRDYLFALRCLGDQIPADRRLVQRLVERLTDETLHATGSARFQRYRQALGEGLSRLAGSDAATTLIPSLTGALGDDDATVRSRAAWSLGQLGPASPEVVAALERALGDARWLVRFRAAESLGQLGQASPEVVAALERALGDDDGEMRYLATESLGQLGPASSGVVAALVRALGDDAADVRYGAAVGLGQLGQASPGVLDVLVESLRDADSGSVRRDAARLLGRIGHDDEATILGLWCGLRDTYGNVRTACAEALALLGRRFPGAAEGIAQKLAQATADPAFNVPDMFERRTGHDCAFDGLWLLMAGGRPRGN
jgi:HEAT repeat protein